MCWIWWDVSTSSSTNFNWSLFVHVGAPPFTNPCRVACCLERNCLIRWDDESFVCRKLTTMLSITTMPSVPKMILLTLYPKSMPHFFSSRKTPPKLKMWHNEVKKILSLHFFLVKGGSLWLWVPHLFPKIVGLFSCNQMDEVCTFHYLSILFHYFSTYFRSTKPPEKKKKKTFMTLPLFQNNGLLRLWDLIKKYSIDIKLD